MLRPYITRYLDDFAGAVFPDVDLVLHETNIGSANIKSSFILHKISSPSGCVGKASDLVPTSRFGREPIPIRAGLAFLDPFLSDALAVNQVVGKSDERSAQHVNHPIKVAVGRCHRLDAENLFADKKNLARFRFVHLLDLVSDSGSSLSASWRGAFLFRVLRRPGPVPGRAIRRLGYALSSNRSSFGFLFLRFNKLDRFS
jgi:hypothetical protein